MIINGDCIEEMQKLIDQGVQVDAVVTDPPYHLQSIVDRFGKTSLNDDTKTSERARGRSDGYARMSAGGFMGQEWDGGDIAFRAETWRLAWELLKPGGHLLAFSASRNYHRMAVAIEDAGFEIRDQMMWLYGSGFPKSMNVGKMVDKQLRGVGIGKSDPKSPLHGTIRQKIDGSNAKHDMSPLYKTQTVEYEYEHDISKLWNGWGTALKPAHEPIAVGRKPISESTVAKNVLKHGTGGINIDACRVGLDGEKPPSGSAKRVYKNNEYTEKKIYGDNKTTPETGRYPANIMHDGSDAVTSVFPDSKGFVSNGNAKIGETSKGVIPPLRRGNATSYGDDGSAARYFYCPKVSKKERGKNNKHPTVKPQELMKYLVRLVTPKGGTVLDPFMGSGSTGMAAKDLGFDFIGIEKSEEYFKICQERIEEINPLGEFLD